MENHFRHNRSQGCNLYSLLSPVSLNLHQVGKSVDASSFLEPVGHSLRTSADLNRRHKPVAEPFLLCSCNFLHLRRQKHSQKARRHVICQIDWRAVDQIKGNAKIKFFSHVLWSSGHRRLEFFPLNFGSDEMDTIFEI